MRCKSRLVHKQVLIICYRYDPVRSSTLGTKAFERITEQYVINLFSDVE